MSIHKQSKISNTCSGAREYTSALHEWTNELPVNNKKRSHTQLDSRKQVIAFQDRVITINIKEAQKFQIEKNPGALVGIEL